jgi:large subunit ribosomal protein L13
MKTTVANPAKIEKIWYLVDAKDKTLGKISTTIANKLRGKDKTIFSPHLDLGDFVIVINAQKVRLTGKKMEKKTYNWHSKFPGGLKEEGVAKMLERNPAKVIWLAVEGMLPKNNLRNFFMKRLKVYKDENHPHVAQNPVELKV